MRILTWNINGVRATKAPLKQVLDSLDADIVCLQETKVTRDQLDEASAIVEGYSSYFSFSKARSGYSGVATYCKDGATPIKAEEGLTGLLVNQKEGDIIGCYGDQTMFTEDELRSLDKEGRAVITQHTIRDTNGKERLLAVINVYCPRADPEKEERKDFKLRFYRLLQTRAQALLQAGSHVIVLGDVNTSHRPIDHCDPDDVEYFSENPGRKWLDQFLYDPHQSGDTLISQSNHSINPNHQSDAASDQLNTSLDSSIQAENASEKVPGGYFVDTFRFFHPTQRSAFTCWCTVTGARQTNYGTRIDYILSNKDLLSQFTDCTIMPEVEGSDHCPVRGELACTIVTASKCPALCSKYMPEFAGKQQKLSVFFTKVKKGETGEEKSSQDSAFSSQSSDGQSDICSQQSSSQPWENCSSESEGSDVLTKQGQGQSRISMKRTASDPVVGRSVKKQKTEQVKTVKQGTLMSFFGKKTKTETVDRRIANSSDFSQENSEVDVKKDVVVSNQPISSSNTTVDDSKEKESKDAENDKNTAETKPKQNQAAFWKTVLKGPPPPPPCKGHKEPCVLRTVKKQGPNFGKQFYVCARPQGHSSNHEARCDHFQWVSRGKDKL
ncbi:DNA-(apurinic or apyrimidinic site) endonuclease 2-like [Branchiostoma lanceolatum]|uniref:DNA-(apurinic or apyrimidinic site) endonuclease 2-like n=1 Tax=Branchiostoma lanceolatum TaxID=7740 RepID=UPI003451F747